MDEKTLNTDTENQDQGVEGGSENNEQQRALSKEQIIEKIDEELAGFDSDGNNSEYDLGVTKEVEFEQKLSEIENTIGSDLSDETKEKIHQNVVEDVIDSFKSKSERKRYLEIMKKASETLSDEDFLYFHNFLEQRGGKLDNLYDFKNKVMHTTNSYTFAEKMLDSGVILTGNKQEGIYGSDGASFTDGDYSEAVTFQSVFDDQCTRSEDKQFNTEAYQSKSESFIKHFWENDEQETKDYLSKISNTKVETLQDAMRIAEGFKIKAKPEDIENNPDELAKLFGITIVFEKDYIPDLSKQGTEGLQTHFELRSFVEGGISLSRAKTMFVPENKIDEIRDELKKYGMENVELRPSEEIEVSRMVNLLEKTE